MLTVVTGPMFSGKSEELLRLVHRSQIAGQRVVLIKPAMDDRYHPTRVVSHAGREGDAYTVHNVADLEQIEELAAAQVIGIDELQFLLPLEAWVEQIKDWLRSGKQVIVAGLDMDSFAEPFDLVATMLARAENVIKLKAVCTCKNGNGEICGGPAAFSQRLDAKGNPVLVGKIFDVGAADKYEPRCPKCFKRP